MSSSPLDKLDKQIDKVVSRVKQLQSENEKLRQKASKLEKTLEKTPDPGDSGQWMQERQAIQERVEQLVEHLESVLEEE